MNREDSERKIRELEEKVRILESENESLTERGEETMLLSLISEQINNLSIPEEIFDIALEQITVLKGLLFSASAALIGNTLKLSRTFCPIKTGEFKNERIDLPPEIITDLERGPVLIECSAPEMKGLGFSDTLADLTPHALLVIPTWGRMFPDHFFVFADDVSLDTLRESSNLLQRAVEMVANRLDNLVLLDQITKLNEKLDEKLEEQDKELKDSENLYQSLVEHIDLGVTLVDDEHNIIMANRAQGKIVGKDPSLFVGKKCFREFENRDHICKNCPGTKSLETGLPTEVVSEVQREDGSRITLRIQAFPIIAEERVNGFIEVVEDVTEKVHAEEDLQRAMKLESMGILAGGIAHDFNNLLTAVLGNISLVKLYAEPKGKIFSKLIEMEKATLRARELTRQLLTFARGGTPVKQTTSVKELAVDAATFALRGSNAKCRFDFPDDLWLVDVDPGQFTQVIQNLVINASQAMPSGGMIYLTAENFEQKAVDQSTLNPGKYLKVLVRDEGEGIAHDIQTKIFDPYFTTKEKGTGIGLATSYTIIKNHDGLLTVDSQPGSGSTFYFYLPVFDQKKAAGLSGSQAASNQATAEVIRGKGKILIMDDEQIILEVAGDMLKYAGYNVVECTSGQEAVEEYRQAIEQGEPFDAVILDLTVPGDGWGGKETLEKLNAIDPEVKAILSSGYAIDPVMQNFGEYGFLAAVSKPYRIERLSRVLDEVLAMK